MLKLFTPSSIFTNVLFLKTIHNVLLYVVQVHKVYIQRITCVSVAWNCSRSRTLRACYLSFVIAYIRVTPSPFQRNFLIDKFPKKNPKILRSLRSRGPQQRYRYSGDFYCCNRERVAQSWAKHSLSTQGLQSFIICADNGHLGEPCTCCCNVSIICYNIKLRNRNTNTNATVQLNFLFLKNSTNVH